MVVILEAVAGPIAGRRIEVREGTILRIGRTAKSDYAVGEDSYLSGQHFAVECDGSDARVRDMGSSNGTFLNGAKVTERTLKEGDSVVAGGSTFTVHIDMSEAAAPKGAPDRVPTVPTDLFPGVTCQLDRRVLGLVVDADQRWAGFSRGQSVLLKALFRDGESVYAVLDPASDSRIPAFLDASGERHVSLEEGGRVVAYVVLLRPQGRLLDVLIKDGWSHAWGFYCAAHVGLDETAEHLRNYVTLHTELGRPLTFRFWDPPLLRAVIAGMTLSEAADFFGPLTRLVVEGEKPEVAVEFSLGVRGAKQQAMVLV